MRLVLAFLLISPIFVVPLLAGRKLIKSKRAGFPCGLASGGNNACAGSDMAVYIHNRRVAPIVASACDRAVKGGGGAHPGRLRLSLGLDFGKGRLGRL